MSICIDTKKNQPVSIEIQLIGSPVHMVNGSPWNPSRQTQLKDPGVLMQVLLPPQCLSLRHSFSSEQHLHYYTC